MKYTTEGNNTFSRDTFLCLKGYMALCIIIHHLYQFTGLFLNTYFGHFLNLLGRYGSFAFMFITGFGLYTSYKNDKIEYIRSFPRKRLFSFYLTYIFFFFIYLIYALLSSSELTISTIIKSLTIGGTIIAFGWYLQIALIAYIVFYCIFKFVKEGKSRSFAILAATFVYTVAAWKLGYPSNQISVFYAFPFGILISEKQDTVEKLLKKSSALIALLSFVIFFLGYMIYVRGEIMGRFDLPAQISLIVYILSEASIVAFILSVTNLLARTCLIVNPISSFIGKYSLELYCCQGIVFMTLFPYFNNPVLFAGVSLIVLSVAAILSHILLTMLLRSNRHQLFISWKELNQPLLRRFLTLLLRPY